MFPFMKNKDIFWGAVEAVIWYLWVYYFLYVLKNEVDLWAAAFVLIALMYVGVSVCPWIRHTSAWKKMTGKE